ncbi:hypothetical protein P280DRAFT_67466 [Massarina eburnea CBS 473.64]|uniref:KANL3/Tex30 alpha/beta hydrolase-like domain-containing protein n=1 Tax=Massarina eburnea CBS 473.64 TaxID=1395130 RepID=A0A6A6RUE8_9PLEO|nr:hypothetical protein P280DRAFT_67466 [Massarina eburnea CBS 473.64]
MPPKRRKSSDPADPPEPKKSATRSSARIKASAQDDPNPALEPAAPKSKKKAKTSKPKSTKESTAPKTKTPKHKSLSESSHGPAILTITHDSVKNPITCHQYTPPTTPTASTPTLIFTHGAGGTLSADAVVNFCNGYAKTSPVLAFQGSMNLAARVKSFHACLSHLESDNAEKGAREERGKEIVGVVLGGRSMGSRAAVMAATDLLSCSSPSSTSPPNISLVLVSYPLKGPKDIRDQILLDLPSSVRVLFIVGDRDGMCPLDLLDGIRKRMKAASRLVVVKGADHGMHVKPAAREREYGEETGVLGARWVDGKLGDDVVEMGGV